jgi:hypothetical protein
MQSADWRADLKVQVGSNCLGRSLYEKMWSQPALTLAQEFGISDRGLRKICARFEIPVPPRPGVCALELSITRTQRGNQSRQRP